MTYCSICFTSLRSDEVVKLPCHCKSCSECLTSWIVTQGLELHYQTHGKIPCMIASCKRPFKIEDIFSQLSSSQQDMVNDILFDVYLKKSEDIRKCPNNKCSYAGVIDPSMSCKKNLECAKCGSQWRERLHYTSTEKIRDFILNNKSQRSELLSDFWQEVFTRRCPKCNVSIQKNGGCNHMTCKKCQHEFCWLCFQTHRIHKRSFCRYSCWAKAIIIFLPLFNLLCLTGIAQIAFMTILAVLSSLMGGITFNLLGLSLYSLNNLIQRRRKYVFSANRKREVELQCFGLIGITLLLMGIIRYFNLYFYVTQVACAEALLAIVFREHTKTVKFYLSYIDDGFRYIMWNRRIIYVYIKSYFLR